MKVAVCLSGESRYYTLGYQYMTPFFKDCELHYYIHSWSKPELVSETLSDLKNFFSPRKILVEPYSNFDDHFNGRPIIDLSPNLSNAVSWLKSVFEVGKLLENDPVEYDYVIFSRSDVVAFGKPFCDLVRVLENDVVYSSFVRGEIWEVDKLNPNKECAVDTKFVCSNKQNIIYFSKLYDHMSKYILEDGVPLCHHRLIYHHMKPLIEKYGHRQMQVGDMGINGGWCFVRENYLQTD